MDVQLRHYGVVRLLTKDVENWLDHIDESLTKNPKEAVKLPNTGAQLDLPDVDHWEIRKGVRLFVLTDVRARNPRSRAVGFRGGGFTNRANRGR